MGREGSRPAKMPAVVPHDSKRRPPVTLLAFLALAAVVLGLWAIQLDRRPAAAPPPLFNPPVAVQPYAIVRVPGRDVVVINAGIGGRVAQGMTFYVYDKQAGIPAVQPAGNRQGSKALVEVVRIGPGFSECRVVSRTPQTALVQGDPVVQAPAPTQSRPVQAAHSGQSPPLPTTAPASAGTNPGRS
jgi:hypothetical protein